MATRQGRILASPPEVASDATRSGVTKTSVLAAQRPVQHGTVLLCGAEEAFSTPRAFRPRTCILHEADEGLMTTGPRLEKDEVGVHERLAASGGHDGEDVPPREQTADGLLLHPAEGVEASRTGGSVARMSSEGAAIVVAV